MHHDNHVIRLVDWSRDNGRPDEISSLLEQYEATNELALWALAGSARKIHSLMSSGRQNIPSKHKTFV